MSRSLAGALAALVCLSVPDAAEAGRFNCSKGSGIEVIDHLLDPDHKVRHDCIDEAEDRRLIQAEENLAHLVQNDHLADVRVSALVALEKLGSQHLIPSAEHLAINDPDNGNRGKALRLIEKFGNESSVPALTHVLVNDVEASLRRKAAVIIGNRKWKAAEPALVEHGLADPDSAVMIEAAIAVVEFANPTARPYVHPILLEHPDERMREKVVRAIEKLPLAGDRDALVTALDDMNPHVARHSARALVRLGDKSVAPILREKAMVVRDGKVAEEFNEAALHLGG